MARRTSFEGPQNPIFEDITDLRPSSNQFPGRPTGRASPGSALCRVPRRRKTARMVDQDFERRIASLYAAREQGYAVRREVRVWLLGKTCRLMFVHPWPRRVCRSSPRDARA